MPIYNHFKIVSVGSAVDSLEPRVMIELDVNDGIEISAEKTMELKGHTDVVPACAWNPKEDLLASASWDTTARIWSIDQLQNEIVLNHKSNKSGVEVNISVVIHILR